MAFFKDNFSRGSIEIKGLKEIQQKLDQLPIRVKKRLIRPGLKQAVEILGNEIKSRAPVDSGKLKESIRTIVHQPAHWGMKAKVIADPKIKRSLAKRLLEAKGTKLSGRLNSYAIMVEFDAEYGTRKREGKRFATKGFEAKKNEAMKAIENHFRANLAKALK